MMFLLLWYLTSLCGVCGVFFGGGNPKIGILDIALNKLPFHVLLLLGINQFVWSTNTSWKQVQKMYYKNKYSDGQSRDSGSWCETRNVSMFSNSLFLCLFCCIYSLFKSFTFSNMLALRSILLHKWGIALSQELDYYFILSYK